MKKSGFKALFIGMILFIGFSIPKFISEEPLTFISFIPAMAGGLVGGLVIYFGQTFLKKST